jgi:hypothetical protein
MHLPGMLIELFRVLALIDIALAQNVESRAPRFVTNV